MIHEKSNFPKPGDMRKEVYDTNNNGIVDNAERVNGHTVDSDVPASAEFTDTTYSEASSEAAGLMSASDKAKRNYSAPQSQHTFPSSARRIASKGFTPCFLAVLI